jgi:hypothetical protein
MLVLCLGKETDTTAFLHIYDDKWLIILKNFDSNKVELIL